MAQLDACLSGEVVGLTPTRSASFFCGDWSWNIFYSFLSHQLIQEGQMSVSGERMCLIMDNCLEEEACSVKVWLDKLIKLKLTQWVDWFIKPQHKQTNKLWNTDFIFLIFHKIICCDYSSEMPHWAFFNEYPQLNMRTT